MSSQDWKLALRGGFAFMTAPFAVHPNDEARAKEFLELAKLQNATLAEVITEAQRYLTEQGCNQEFINKELGRFKKVLQNLVILTLTVSDRFL